MQQSEGLEMVLPVQHRFWREEDALGTYHSPRQLDRVQHLRNAIVHVIN